MGVNEMPDFDLMAVEHDAWLEAMARMRTIGIEPNDPKMTPVIHQLQYWGETLVALRVSDPVHIEKALEDAKARARENAVPKVVFVNVNEEGEVYDTHFSLDDALAVQAEFPNDTVQVRRV